MNHRSIIVFFLILQGIGICRLSNPSFEIEDPNSTWFSKPAGWHTLNYAALHDSFIPVVHDGHKDPDAVTWSIESPDDGSSFLVLSTGDTDGLGSDPPDIQQAYAISGDFFLEQGSTFYFSYIFGTCDWYADYCSVSLLPCDPNINPDNTEIVLLTAQVLDIERGIEEPDISKYSSSGDWKTIYYTIQPDQQGMYQLKCLVADQSDAIYKSYLAIDNIKFCRPSKSFGDINRDCQVDLNDFSLFASAWITECIYDPNHPLYDPNDLCDPNIPVKESDFDQNWIVDIDDLNVISDHWLDSFWSN